MQNFNPARFPLILYKRILRLHYGLPQEMRLMGDTYVKDEFKRHKTCSQEQALVFLKEWTDYCTMLSKQLSNKGIADGELGRDLDPNLLEKMEEEQLYQLYELKFEAEKWGQGNLDTSEQPSREPARAKGGSKN